MSPSSSIADNALLTTAINAVARACAATRDVQTSASGIKKLTKDDRSPVTVADYAAQALIAEQLAATCDIPLVGEEDAAQLRDDQNAPLRAQVHKVANEFSDGLSEIDMLSAIDYGNHDASADRYWTLDPIDGTKGFLRGGQYAVSLALIVAGEVRLGVLGCPNLSADFDRPFDDPDPIGTILWAAAGGGAFSSAIDEAGRDTGERILTSNNDDPIAIRACESVEASHSRLDDSSRILDHLGAAGQPARLDSQCKYAVVARGQADVYLRLPTSSSYVEKIWDHAAGMIVAQEAGAKVSDMRGRDLDFGHGAGLSQNAGVICASGNYHPLLMNAINELGLA